MADCLYHGYSGGPGPCGECKHEDDNDLERGTLLGDNSAAADVIKSPKHHPDATVRGAT